MGVFGFICDQPPRRQTITRVSLSELIAGLPQSVSRLQNRLLNGVTITGIALDSRKVAPGDLFIALSGGNTDGHLYIPDAIRRGAAAVVGTQPLSGLPLPYVQVEDGRLALAYLSAAFYGFPARRMVMIGVTGTDGKTTTASLLFNILKSAGLATGMISTVSAVIGNESLDTGFHVTTPEAPDVQRYLANMVAAGLTHVVLEATSHGLAQHRVAYCDFDIGVVTNITHEHLDYHGSYEAYRAAKARLFTGLQHTPVKPLDPPRGAVLNLDDSSYPYLTSLTAVPSLSYSLHAQGDVRAENILRALDGLRFTAVGAGLQGHNFSFPVFSPLVGEYNISNCLAAIAATVGVLGLEPEAVRQGIASLSGVPGRAERQDLGQDFTALVDFAHTPNALRRILEAGRQIVSRRREDGRVIAVFGSAGLRDRAKRRLMAEVAADLADLTVLTAEDPRTESLEIILAEMAAGMDARGAVEGKSYWRIPDRGEAIRLAVHLAGPGDLVVACGKGHEQTMCFGETEYAWDDRIALRAAIAERLGIPGPEMPYLPTRE